jgi:DeoR/GlpR family transcriptional regulator of sugar metabolism
MIAGVRRMHGTGDYTITDLAELFNISRPTVYRTLAAVETVAAQRSRR